MTKKWLILGIIILMYLPVSIDATVLHVATPRLSVSLGASNNELLWIMDIYSLVMAGFLLPMGALGDRIGFKRLALLGSVLFGLASLGAAISSSPSMLILARGVLGIGAAMILPATLSGLRLTFTDEKQRNLALGIWVAVGTGGATIGPLVGGFLLEHFYWGSVFLINLPILALVIFLTVYLLPQQPMNMKQPLYFGQALSLTASLLLLIFVLKNILRANTPLLLTSIMGVLGLVLLVWFIRKQLNQETPMIDIGLLKNKSILLGVGMALSSIIAMIGFELLMAQELQFVIGKSPLQAALFMLPLMVTSALCGPIAAKLASLFSLRYIAITGMAISAISFWGLSATHFASQPIQAWLCMCLLGLGASATFFTATSTIMSSAPPERATAAGAIEGISYELGAGLGVAIFGLMLASLYTTYIDLPNNLPLHMAPQASASISEAMQLIPLLDENTGAQLTRAAQHAFSTAHSVVLIISGAIFALLTIPVWLQKKW